MDEDASPLEREHSLPVVLPGGLEETTTVHGSKPVMDLLVTLCASHHLNPSDYTVEILSPSNTSISFKPNSPIGLLEAEKLVLKPRAGEEKIRTPYMPEATVRLLINYNKSHKAVVRVNPRLPLERLLPVVCDKCEFEVESTVLLRDCESKDPLDLSRTLNELGLREVFAKDTAAKNCTGPQQLTAAALPPEKVSSSSSLQDLTKTEKKKSENKGLFSFFIKPRKKSELSHAVSAPTSPGLKSRSASLSTQDVASSPTPPADLPKKRRAPPPPMGASNSTPNHLSTSHLQEMQRSGDDTLRKRRAPPPPVPNHDQDATKDSLKFLDQLKESEDPESVTHPSSSSLSPAPSLPCPPPLHKTPDLTRPTVRGKDLSDARAALAEVLTSSLSSGTLIKRLKSSTPFPDVHNGTSCMSEDDADTKSVRDANLTPENEFEDPADRKGFTTFKVAPSRKGSDMGLNQDVPATEETDAELDKEEEKVVPEGDQTPTAEDSPDQSESGSPMPRADEEEEEAEEEETTTTAATSRSLPLDGGSSSLDEAEDVVKTAKPNEEHKAEDESDQSREINERDLYSAAEEVEACPSEWDACGPKTCGAFEQSMQDEEKFPPPPPPVYFNEDLDEVKASSPDSVTNGHVPSNNEPPPVARAPGSPGRAVPAPDRFAQAVALALQRSRVHSAGKTISALVQQDT